ncbi:MAG TPA: VWA domain-containing protein [Thermodesulfobacteriota bacterium]|nr:VWA domain-containing protein [Thermodesulfobacteriota bacterium]
MKRRLSSENIETDSYDRELFGDLESESEGLGDLIGRGSSLLPGFRPLMLDLFAAFYKHNVVFLPEEGVRRSSLLPRRLLLGVGRDPDYASLREDTVLDAYKSALAAMQMGEMILEWLKSGDGPGEKPLMREWETDRAERDAEEISDESETMEEVAGEEVGRGKKEERDKEGEGENVFEKVRREKKSELDREEKALKKITDDLKKGHENMEVRIKGLVRSSMKATSDNVDNAEDELTSWSASMGAPGERSAAEKLDLAARLYSNEKLRRLARLVGSLKEEMLRGRRKSWARRGSEVYDVALGSDIGRLIPSELAALADARLRPDFKKRLLEGKLLQYSLRDEKGRGPMVICLDGSSSMEGKKELWSKGVCLTLLDIARRERRKFSVIVFSSGGMPVRVFESSPGEGRGGWGMKEKDVFELAGYFPGGGTNFEEPLDRALDILKGSKFRRGDIVFITDGEAGVGDAWLEGFRSERARLGFKVYSVLIDLTERESWETLSLFSDKVTSVSKLTSDAAKGLFLDL